MFITPSTFSDFPFLAPPPRLFQPPRLLERWEYGHRSKGGFFSESAMCFLDLQISKEKKIQKNNYPELEIQISRRYQFWKKTLLEKFQ